MKKLFKSIIAVSLVFSMITSFSIVRSYGLATAAGVGSLLIGAYQVLNDASATAAAKQAAIDTINHSWIRSSEWSGAIWTEIDHSVLSSLVQGLTSNGQPCQIIMTTHNGYDVYVLKAIDEPFVVATGGNIMSNSNIKNSYYGVSDISSGGSTFVYYSLYQSPTRLLDLIKNAVQGIATSVSNITADIDHIDTMLTTSLPALFKTQVGSATLSVADLEYNIWQSVDDLETSVSNIYSRLGTMIGYVDGIEGQLTNIYARQQDTNDVLEDIYIRLAEDAVNPVLVSNSLVDSNDADYPRETIPYESATHIVAYLNEHFYSKKVSVLDPSNSVVSRWFMHAELTQNGYIRVRCSAFNNSTSSTYSYYLCDLKHNIIVSSQPTYIQYLTATVNNADVSLAALLASVDANITTMNANVDAMAQAVANINASFNMGGLHLDLGNSSSNPLYTTQAANDLYLSSYSTDSGGTSYDLISSPYQSTTDIIGYINSEMVGKEITRLPRRGDTRDGEMICYVDHAYLDDNNMIRVAARNAVGTLSQYFLCSPEMALYQSIAQPLIDLSSISAYIQDIDTEIHSTNSALGRLEVYTDGIEGYLRTCNQSLSNIQTNTGDIKLIDQQILDHLDSSDLVDDAFISDMVDDWGDHLVYTVLSSDNVLSLFNAAFGDLPSDLDWAGARGFFEAFYRGDE